MNGQAVIIAGGKGTRLAEVSGGLPKAMVEVGGKPLLEHQLLLAKRHGFEDILLLTGFGAGHIEDCFRDGSGFEVRIRYVREPQPLGTAGAVLNAWDELAGRFIVLYGDTLLNVDLRHTWNAHPPGSAATLFLHPNDHPHDSDLVEVDESNRVLALHSYPHPPGEYFRNLVNAALYVVEKSALEPFRSEPQQPLDFGKHVLPAMLNQGRHLHGHITREYIKDAGTPRRLERVRLDYASGRVARSSLDHPLPAVFFDRDGTLNHERDWLSAPGQLELLPGAADAVRRVNESGRLAVVITNQPVIARGDCTEAGLRIIHNKLEWLLGAEHAYLDGLYYCPHHPDSGFPGERPELKFQCACRKPATGLFERAVRDLNIDLQSSYMIGDRPGDINAAKNLGIPSVLVRTGPASAIAHRKCTPDFECDGVLDAVDLILRR